MRSLTMQWILVMVLVLGSSITDGQQRSAPPPLSKEQLAEAIAAAEKLLAIQRQALGTWHADVADTLEFLATMHEQREEFETARKERREVLDIRVKLHGEQHWKATDARLALGHLNLLASLTPAQRQQLAEADGLNLRVVRLHGQRQWSEAVVPAQQALAIRKQVLGDKHPDYAVSLNNLASLYQAQGDYARAESLFQQALEIRRRLRGTDTPAMLSA